MINVLVTGGYGQLGDKLAEKLNQHSEIFKDFLFSFKTHRDFNLCDGEQMEREFETFKPNIVINLAAYTDVNKAEKDEENVFEVNAYGVRRLAYLCKDYGAFLIHISTDYVFPGDKAKPLEEDDKRMAVNAYGRSKNWGEVYIEDSGCEHIIIRTSWLYSDTQHTNFVKTIVDKLRYASNAELYVSADEIASPTYAGDLAEFIIGVITSDYKAKQGVYHYCNRGTASRYDFAKAIQDIMSNMKCIKPDMPIHPGYNLKTGVNRPHYSVLDNRKVEQTFGIKIPYWRDSLKIALNNIVYSESETEHIVYENNEKPQD